MFINRTSESLLLIHNKAHRQLTSLHFVSPQYIILLSNLTESLVTLQQYLRDNCRQMTSTKQLVISLNRLTLPSDRSLTKITLSIFSSPFEYFIQNQKVVRGERINFYRQNLFVNYNPQGLSFRIYEIDMDGNKKLVISLKVQPEELLAVRMKPSTFQTSHQGFDLAWESWIYSDDSSDLNQESSRDYTQLDLPFENNLSQISGILMNSQSLKNILANKSRTNFFLKNRNSSTEETPSLTQKEDGFSSNQNDRLINSEEGPSPNKGKLSKAMSMQKRKANIKSRFYQSFVTRISSLLTHRKQ